MLLVFGVTVLFIAGVVGLVSISHQPDQPQPTTARLLDCDPDFYSGKRVSLKTDGMETVDQELAYRKQSDKPYIVRCRFKSSRLPEKMPETITGLCIGRQGAAVILVDCH